MHWVFLGQSILCLCNFFIFASQVFVLNSKLNVFLNESLSKDQFIDSSITLS